MMMAGDFLLGYQPQLARDVERVIQQFHKRRLVIPLYHYNRTLNMLRDHLFQHHGHHALR